MEEKRGLWIYLDNSNLWIGAKRTFGQRFNNQFYSEDPRVRIDPKKLVQVLCGGANVIKPFFVCDLQIFILS